MSKNFINELIIFLANPYGMIGIFIGVLIFIKASSSRTAKWLIFSFFCFATSLGKFEDQWIKEPPSLLFPLQQIREYGRPLSILVLVFLICLSFKTHDGWRRMIFPQSINYFLLVQSVFFLKTLFYGSAEFALLSGMTFSGIIFMLRIGPGRWIQNDENFNFAVRSIAVVGLIFVIPNTYQYLINPYAVTFSHHRFVGTTGNPQHAAVLLATIIPCLIFLIQSSKSWISTKVIWAVTLIGLMYFLVLTGSRTGVLMIMVSILLFFRSNMSAWFRLLLFLAMLIIVAIPFVHLETLNLSLGVSSSISDRFTANHDTRTVVWNTLWINFSENILFGAPLQGDRMGYAENSWLTVASNTGLVGLIPMLLMGWESLHLILQLSKLSTRDSRYFLQSGVVISGLGSMLVGSYFESLLMGSITFPQTVFLTYLMMGSYLLEIDRVRTYYTIVDT